MSLYECKLETVVDHEEFEVEVYTTAANLWGIAEVDYEGGELGLVLFRQYCST